jgi:hypothetical protein
MIHTIIYYLLLNNSKEKQTSTQNKLDTKIEMEGIQKDKASRRVFTNIGLTLWHILPPSQDLRPIFFRKSNEVKFDQISQRIYEQI